MLRLSRQQARRLLVRAQRLDLPRPDDLLEVVHDLGVVQVDTTRAVAASHELVPWSRLGSAYDPEAERLARAEGSLVEWRGMLRTAEDTELCLPLAEAWPGPPPLKEWQEGLRDWLAANDDARRDVLAQLRDEGPLPSRALRATCAVPWRSSGWTDERSTRRLVDLLEARGEVAVAAWRGRDRLWDLGERVLPRPEGDRGDRPAYAEARALRDERRLASLGLARATGPEADREGWVVGAAGEECEVEGTAGRWRVDAALLASLEEHPFEGRTALLSPLDRLVMDRGRALELLDFDFQLEMYKPAARRRWGYWAMPVLHGDRLVARLDATADRKAGVLRVDALHEDEPLAPDVLEAVHGEVGDLAAWLGLGLDDRSG